MATSGPGQTPLATGVGDIIKSIQGDVRSLVQDEIELAKQELTPAAKNAGIGGGMFGAALYFILNALILLFIAGALGIWAWLGVPIAVAFVIMAGVMILIAAILALIGYARVKKVKGPEQAIAQGQETADAVKAAIARGNAAANAKKIEGEVRPQHAVTGR
jgi:Flp pilus assembly protein TadB